MKFINELFSLFFNALHDLYDLLLCFVWKFNLFLFLCKRFFFNLMIKVRFFLRLFKISSLNRYLRYILKIFCLRLEFFFIFLNFMFKKGLKISNWTIKIFNLQRLCILHPVFIWILNWKNYIFLWRSLVWSLE